ncbi:hypothetical protein [Populibacterium corticicola]|uniref:hypothetical protein n=1 Tax=Populibacterium corticicola TaxID=1812826 RepID=UPI00366C815B
MNDLAQTLMEGPQALIAYKVRHFIDGGVEITNVFMYTLFITAGILDALPPVDQAHRLELLHHSAQGIFIPQARAARLVLAHLNNDRGAVNAVYAEAETDYEKDEVFMALSPLPRAIMRGMPDGMLEFTVGGQS